MFPLSDTDKAERFPIVTIGIILLNIYVFYLQITSPNPDAFIQTYALIPSTVNFADPTTLLRFVTAMFMHGGFLHIISNMWFLWIFGDNVESYLGRVQYLLFYLFAGLVGNFLQFFLMPTSAIPMLGASGAIAGVLGAYFILFPGHKVKTLLPVLFIFVVDLPAILVLGYWFVLQVLSGFESLPGAANTGGVAFFAHIGGFVTGMILAKLFKPSDYVQRNALQA